ncbi:MAG: hypothetical protein H6883_00440 [Rhodobiaceae bacterium]|nr:hypothetical protein [Rhodobiaceae bacterium]
MPQRDGLYWDRNDKTREFSKTVLEKAGRLRLLFANALSTTRRGIICKAVKKAGTTEAKAVVDATVVAVDDATIHPPISAKTG